MLGLRRLAVATVLAAAASSSTTASAFQQSSVIGGSHSLTNLMVNQSPRRNTVALMYYDPFYDPYFNPYYYYPNTPPYYIRPPPPPMMYHPRYSFALDAEAEVIADEFLDDLREEEEWMSDRERAQRNKKSQQQQKGEVIDLDSLEPQPELNQPLKSAASYVDEAVFQGRKPGQAVNRNDDSGDNESEVLGSSSSTRRRSIDPREQHVLLDDFDEYSNDFFRPSSARPPRQPQRPGPSVYTAEEEELIASMGGRQPPPPKSQQNFNPIPPPLPPYPDQPPPQQFREEGYLGDSTLKEISLDYSIPIPYLADVIATWGAPVPIDPNVRLGDLVTGEQAFAILEAIHTLDIAALHEMYSEETLMTICEYYDVDLKEAFEFCVGRGWGLPFGVRTFLRVEQEEELLDVLG